MDGTGPVRSVKMLGHQAPAPSPCPSPIEHWALEGAAHRGQGGTSNVWDRGCVRLGGGGDPGNNQRILNTPTIGRR